MLNNIMKLKFKFRIPKIELREINKIWNWELFISAILLALFLSWDAWIYFKLAEPGKNQQGSADYSKVISIKKDNLEVADNKLNAYKDFLDNPGFTP